MSREETHPERPRRIWVIDDSKLEAEMARRALEGHHQIEVFNDSSAALEQLTSRAPPDVLILDWVMPGLSGIDVCEFVRKRPETMQLPVLLLTTNQQTAQIVEGLGAGANDYLAKPYAPAELSARVAALIRSHELLLRAERAEGLLRRVLAQLPDVVITVDEDNQIVFVNQQLEKLRKEAARALIGRKLQEIFPALELDKLAESVASHTTLPDIPIADRIFSPRVSIPPKDDLGNTTITFRDVTDVRARDARRVDFYSMIAHDLRSPLSAVQGRAQLLVRGLRGELSPEVKADLNKMIARTQELVQIVNDFLDIEQMESLGFKIENRQQVDLAVICREVCDEYQPVAISRGIELTVDTMPDALVMGDPRRLAQVIGNLISNALKFTASGGKVSVEAHYAGSSVEVVVIDTGRGISPAAQARVFIKYERAPNASASRAEGTGLGLAIVKEIVEAHGGTVGVRSEEGKGSTFWIRLPEAHARG